MGTRKEHEVLGAGSTGGLPSPSSPGLTGAFLWRPPLSWGMGVPWCTRPWLDLEGGLLPPRRSRGLL